MFTRKTMYVFAMGMLLTMLSSQGAFAHSSVHLHDLMHHLKEGKDNNILPASKVTSNEISKTFVSPSSAPAIFSILIQDPKDGGAGGGQCQTNWLCTCYNHNHTSTCGSGPNCDNKHSATACRWN